MVACWQPSFQIALSVYTYQETQTTIYFPSFCRLMIWVSGSGAGFLLWCGFGWLLIMLTHFCGAISSKLPCSMLIGGLWGSRCHRMRLSGSLWGIPTNNAKEGFSCFPQWSVVGFPLIKETHMGIITENQNWSKCRVAEPSTNRSTVSLLHLRLRDRCESGARRV